MTTYAETHRHKMAERSRDISAKVADIGVIPDPVNARRRKKCCDDLEAFLRTYFTELFTARFSDDHLRFIHQLQDTMEHGGRDLRIVFRGFGKTTIHECAITWAICKQLMRFPVLLGANDHAARNNLASIKIELEANDLLAEDFPEVCIPVRKLEGKHQRCASQHCQGARTHIEWKQDHLITATIKDRCRSICVVCKGLMSVRRGLTYRTPHGEQLRPDFVLVDDPQTDQSARSPYQIQQRLDKLYRTVLMLGGHKKKIACSIGSTILTAGDLIDRLADQEQHPDWRASRSKMVISWSKAHDDHWLTHYADKLQNYDRGDPADRVRARKAARKYYQLNRKAMDEGAAVTWRDCYSKEDDEVSAIQHAYNLLIEMGREAFSAECQNDPLIESHGADVLLTAPQLLASHSGTPRGLLPVDAHTLTAAIDVQQKLLYWMVVAWSDGFTGHVVDWGAHPDQKRRYWTLSDARHTLRRKYHTTEEGSIHQGLDELVGQLASRSYKQHLGDGSQSPRLIVVDSAWSTAVVYSWHQQAKFRGLALPYRGRGVRAKDKPISEWTPGKGDRLGREWMITRAGKSSRASQLLMYDANYWKSRVYNALALPQGTAGRIAMPRSSPSDLQLLADHWLSERCVKVTAGDRSKLEWELPNNRLDNHFWDTLTASTVAASVCGLRTELEATPEVRRTKKRVKYL